MNKQETVQIITLLAGNYESIANKSEMQQKMMLNTWYECLKDLDYKLILQAVKKSIINNTYAPTIHEIRKNATEITKPVTNITAIEAWNEAYKMICNGLYMTEEQFEQHSPIVKRFFGNVRQVKELAQTDADVVNSVTKGQFLKQYDILIDRESKQNMLPEDMKDLINKLSSKMDIRQIEGN